MKKNYCKPAITNYCGLEIERHILYGSKMHSAEKHEGIDYTTNGTWDDNRLGEWDQQW